MRTRRLVKTKSYTLRKKRLVVHAAFGKARPSNAVIKGALKLAREMGE